MAGPLELTRLPRGVYWALLAGTVLGAVHWVSRLDTPAIYRDDLVHDYVLACAILEGQNPYRLPAPELAERYLPASQRHVPPYVVPHPPPAAFLSLKAGPNWTSAGSCQSVRVKMLR